MLVKIARVKFVITMGFNCVLSRIKNIRGKMTLNKQRLKTLQKPVKNSKPT